MCDRESFFIGETEPWRCGEPGEIPEIKLKHRESFDFKMNSNSCNNETKCIMMLYTV